MGFLRFLGFEEFAAGRKIVKKLPYLDGGSRRAGSGFHLHQLSPLHLNASGFRALRIPFTGGQGESTDTGDAGQGLATKAHALDRRQVRSLLNLAGGMALQTHQGIIPMHADAIVSDSNQAASSGIQLDRDAPGLGINGIFHQLLDHTGRSLDDLACCNLVGYLIG